MSTQRKFKTVDEYIGTFPGEVQKTLEQMRNTIKQAAPEAEEAISYNMPGYRFHGMLVYFAGYSGHIGFYATPTGHKEFKKELAAYKTGKGSVQFPLDRPVPLDLVSRIVRFRVQENMSRKREKKPTAKRQVSDRNSRNTP